MNLSNIMQVQDATARKLLYEEWKQDQAWKEKLEQRVRDLEAQKQHTGLRVKVGEHLLETSFKKVT